MLGFEDKQNTEKKIKNKNFNIYMSKGWIHLLKVLKEKVRERKRELY